MPGRRGAWILSMPGRRGARIQAMRGRRCFRIQAMRGRRAGWIQAMRGRRGVPGEVHDPGWWPGKVAASCSPAGVEVAATLPEPWCRPWKGCRGWFSDSSQPHRRRRRSFVRTRSRILQIIPTQWTMARGIPIVLTTLLTSPRTTARRLNILLLTTPKTPLRTTARRLKILFLAARKIPVRERRLVLSNSLPVVPQHHRHIVPDNVSFKDNRKKLEGPSSPFPMIDISLPQPATEVPEASSSLAGEIISGKMKLEAASPERSRAKLARSHVFVDHLETSRRFFEQEEEEEELEDQEEEDN